MNSGTERVSKAQVPRGSDAMHPHPGECQLKVARVTSKASNYVGIFFQYHYYKPLNLEALKI